MGKASQMEVCVSEKGYEQLLASGKMPEDCMLRRGQSEAKMPKPCSHGIRGSFQTCGKPHTASLDSRSSCSCTEKYNKVLGSDVATHTQCSVQGKIKLAFVSSEG